MLEANIHMERAQITLYCECPSQSFVCYNMNKVSLTQNKQTNLSSSSYVLLDRHNLQRIKYVVVRHVTMHSLEPSLS